MRSVWVRFQAPFAAFRWMQAGVWRGTSPTIPPSAAWGLLLNLAGVETRSPEPGLTTQVRTDAPRLEVAIGELHPAGRGVLYQQLHTYPVGNSGAERKARSHGAKYWIAPTNRELLIDLDVVVGARSADEDLIEAIAAGARGEQRSDRYGLPFAGDNNFLFDRIEVVGEPPAARWYCPMVEGAAPQEGSCRLTVGIDRADASRTTARLFAPSAHIGVPPESAWTLAPGPQ